MKKEIADISNPHPFIDTAGSDFSNPLFDVSTIHIDSMGLNQIIY